MVAVQSTSVPWGNECLGTIERGSKQAGGEIRKTNTKERWEGKGNIEGERRRFKNSLGNLHWIVYIKATSYVLKK